MAFLLNTIQKPVLSLKETPSSTGTIEKEIVLGSSLLVNVVDVLLTNAQGNVILKKPSGDITVQDLTSLSSLKIRAFGVNSNGTITCGIIYISSSDLGVRNGLISPNGVIEVHAKSSTTPELNYS